MNQPPKIIVAAATYNRPKGLALLLDKLEQIVFSENQPAVEVVIVDNSTDANARGQVEATAARYRFPLHYRHQTERGIAQARNMALETALALEGDHLAFIDDDEYPAPQWLDRMLTVSRGATAAIGVLLPDFEVPPPDWIVKGGFLRIDGYEEGQALDFGNTSNVIFDLHFVRRHGLKFDIAFGLTGGEDTLFFEEMLANGGRIVFCKTGIVYETIVADRARLGWLVPRWIRSGNTNGRILMRLKPGLKTRFVDVLAGGMVRFLVGSGLALVKCPAALAGSGHHSAEHLRWAARGVGFMMAATGSVIEEYRVIKR